MSCNEKYMKKITKKKNFPYFHRVSAQVRACNRVRYHKQNDKKYTKKSGFFMC